MAFSVIPYLSQLNTSFSMAAARMLKASADLQSPLVNSNYSLVQPRIEATVNVDVITT